MAAKILLIDNTTTIKSPWKKVLSTHFHTVEAVGGFEAVRKLEAEIFELVIVNISLKSLKGVEAVGKIRSKFLKIPIIVLYNPKDVLDLKQAKVYGVDHSISLPLDVKNLLTIITRIIPEDRFKQVRESIKKQSDEKIPLKSNNKEYIDVEKIFYEGLSAISGQDIKGAIKIFESLINITRIKRESWRRYLEDALFQLGQCYATLRDYRRSNAYYNKFITKAPHNSSHKSALLYLGKNYLALRDYDIACNYFNKVVNMRPYDSFSTQARKLLRKIALLK